jgi:hypothetical protein
MDLMFFRREKPPEVTFAERLERLKRAGYTVQQPEAGKAVLVRDGFAVLVENETRGKPRIRRAGYIVGREIGELVDLGYQKEWRTRSGVREPALATQLKTLHHFLEDVREQLALPSFYNESLGTVNDAHHYDRLAGREGALPQRAISERNGTPASAGST